ncbi:MAG: MoxR family ATPase [Lachnospiraceae bacterium]|nr:MoxR family ATPase [Lachnospiraceae bacterium]
MKRETLKKLKNAVGKRIIGKDKLIDEVIITLISGGHILLEDVPGVGKTKLARAFSESCDMSFSRIQLTPDTLPGDIVGSSIFDRNKGEFKTVLGPIAANIVLADELNRTGPKTQAALLEAMEEEQVTLDGVSYTMPKPFFVIATQNPVGSMGTYPLPEAELDRFMMKRSVGYPKDEDAVRLGRSFLEGALDEAVEPVMSAEDIMLIRDEVKRVTVSDELISYVVAVIEATRLNKDVICGCSPRASLDLLRASQARAYMEGREFVIPEDVYDMAPCVLSHRLILSSEAKMNRKSGEGIIKDILSTQPIPR